jgi:hypothetical protein
MNSTRRQFISQATTTLLLIPLAGLALANVNCGGGGTSSPSPSGGTPPVVGDITTESSVASDPTGPHQHSVTVLSADLTTPPTAGVTFTSTTTNNHAHTIMLTAEQLKSLDSGQEVTVTSSSTGHTHDFMIKKA